MTKQTKKQKRNYREEAFDLRVEYAELEEKYNTWKFWAILMVIAFLVMVFIAIPESNNSDNLEKQLSECQEGQGNNFEKGVLCFEIKENTNLISYESFNDYKICKIDKNKFCISKDCEVLK